MEQTTLETDRLVLKVLDDSFADRVLDYYVRNQSFLEPWEPHRDESFYTLETHQRQLQTDLQKIESGDLFRIWIFKKEDLNFTKTLGTIGLDNIVRGSFQSCFLGYKLDQTEINKGDMTEALTAVIQYAFTKMGLHRIEANIIPENIRSMKVAEELGFYNEGLAKKYLKINGKWEDHIHMVLRNEAME